MIPNLARSSRGFAARAWFGPVLYRADFTRTLFILVLRHTCSESEQCNLFGFKWKNPRTTQRCFVSFAIPVHFVAGVAFMFVCEIKLDCVIAVAHYKIKKETSCFSYKYFEVIGNRYLICWHINTICFSASHTPLNRCTQELLGLCYCSTLTKMTD